MELRIIEIIILGSLISVILITYIFWAIDQKKKRRR